MSIPLIDIHTHDETAPAPAVISVAPGYDYMPGHRYSVGIHPWDTPDADPDALCRLAADAARPEVVAIGETGLDKLKGGDLERQTQLLRAHIELSERVGKPLILHVVKAYPEIIALRKQTRPTQPWVIHGFRGGPELAAQLLRHGFDISLGARFNPDTARMIPSERLHIETDCAPVTIAEVASAVAKSREGLKC